MYPFFDVTVVPNTTLDSLIGPGAITTTSAIRFVTKTHLTATRSLLCPTLTTEINARRRRNRGRLSPRVRDFPSQ